MKQLKRDDMQDIPFDVISCSWPQPVTATNKMWVSDPVWYAPHMPVMPQPQWQSFNQERCWTIDWRQWFKQGVAYWQSSLGGEMRGFQVMFRIRVLGSGKLVFWDDDGCVIRRHGSLIHDDRTVHPPTRSEIEVRIGDQLEIAHWQRDGEWLFGAYLEPDGEPRDWAADRLAPYLERVVEKLKSPNGPPLKMYFSGHTPVRTIVALYSLILRGYQPENIYLFGEYQWSDQSKAFFHAHLPFATIVDTADVLARLETLGYSDLPQLACQSWTMMKTCIGLLYPPQRYCFMDDDLFILDRLDDALHAFHTHDLVFAPDTDYGDVYRSTWSLEEDPLPTGRLNTGLYFLSHKRDPKEIVDALMQPIPIEVPDWQWEQGFMASQFANSLVKALSSQRYFYPYFDGLPGGVHGYDYAQNPCGFAAIHFGGLAEKPSDRLSLVLAPDILDGVSS